MSELGDVFEQLVTFPDALLSLRERLLANLVMISQIPAPTGSESQRIQYVLDRFIEGGVSNAAEDEVGNAVARLEGKTGNRTILLVSHLDSIIAVDQEHAVTAEAGRIVSPGVADNAMGTAIVSLLPLILEHLHIELDSDLLLLGSTQSLGRGNHAGIRFFLDHAPQKIDFGICVEGIQLGRINYFSIGTARADITCTVRPVSETSRSYGDESALIILNNIINRLLTISTPSRPYTVIKIGKIRAGVSYDIEPDHAELGLEIVSHSDEMIEEIIEQIKDIVAEMTARHAVEVNFDVFFKSQAGGIPFAHPLVKCVLDVMMQLTIEPDQGHSPSELSVLIRKKIPSVTIGITKGEKNRKRKPDYVLIDPILTGVAQLVGLLLAIDKGGCDEV